MVTTMENWNRLMLQVKLNNVFGLHTTVLVERAFGDAWVNWEHVWIWSVATYNVENTNKRYVALLVVGFSINRVYKLFDSPLGDGFIAKFNSNEKYKLELKWRTV
jgi:hypothetical protein